MKELFRNNYITVTAFTGIVFGIAYHDEILSVIAGPLGIEVHMYMFKKRVRTKKPSSF
jgi:hypothetical protein